MTDSAAGATTGAATTGPSAQEPAYASLRECLDLQADAAPLSRLSRILGVDPLARNAVHAYRGALAELTVAKALCSLDGWTIVHSVQTSSGTIDHVVVGPPGIFCIMVRNHAGQKIWVGERTFMADGVLLPHTVSADGQRKFVDDRISPAISGPVRPTSCIVVAQPAELVMWQPLRRLEVLTARTFAPWLRGHPRLLSPGAVSMIADVVTDRAVWPAVIDRPDDTHDRLREFEQLRQLVVRAYRRRLIWTMLGAVVTCGLVIARTGALAPFGL